MNKIVSWNMDCDNGNPRYIEDLIKDENPVLVCLQEVSLSLKEHIESSLCDQYPHITSAIDHHNDGIWDLASERTSSYLMILSKHQFEGEPIRHTHKRGRVRTKLARFRGWHECIEHHGVDIVFDGVSVRIINLHIACAETTKNKWRQFRRAVKDLKKKRSAVVCGDLNITANPEPKHLFYYALRRGLMGSYSIKDLLQKRERRIFRRIIKKKGLLDNLGWKCITHPASGLVLDKILVSKDLGKKSEVHMLPKQYGSDHHPLVLIFKQRRPA